MARFQNYKFVHQNIKNRLAIPFHMEIITLVALIQEQISQVFTNE
jgi:hypothetical protein